MVLACLGCQITEALDLLRNPEQWLSRLADAERRYPEVAPAVSFFRDEYIPMREADRTRLTNPFMDKIFPFTLDPHLLAMFGTNTPGINWQEVEETGQTVLLDYRDEQDTELRRFKLLWAFSYLYEHIKLRGRRQKPFALIVDEFAALTQNVFAGENPLAAELDEFINQYMRNHNIWLTVAHQEVFQIDEQLRNTLLSLDTYIFGRTSSMEAARILADHLFMTDPFHVKHYRKVWARDFVWQPHYVLDLEPEFLPLMEQRELMAQRIKRLGLFEFLVRPAMTEGQVSASVMPISIHTVDRDKETGEYLFPDQELVARVRSLLASSSGIPIAVLLKEQAARLSAAPLRGAGEQPQPRQLGNGSSQEQRNGTEAPEIKLAPRQTSRPVQRRERVS
jgi:hypothetical protein